MSTTRLIEQIVRLRRAELSGAPSEVADVRDHLAALIGPAVDQALCCRMLGIGRGTLDRHVAACDIPLTASGGIPFDELLRILLLLEDIGSDETARAALVRVLRGQRAAARERLPAGALEIPPAGATAQDEAERVDLVMHRAVALLLNDQMLADAECRLRRRHMAGTIDAHWAYEWQWTFSFPVEEIARLISADDARGRELRRRSPLAELLSHHERMRVMALLDDADSAR